MMTGVTLKLDTAENEHMPPRTDRRHQRPAVKATSPPMSCRKKFTLRIERMYHGNIKVSSIDADFVDSAITGTGNRRPDLQGPGRRRRILRRGEGEKAKESAVADSTTPCYGCAKKQNAASPSSAQRSGEDEPIPAVETTMTLPCAPAEVQIEDAIAADQIFLR